MMHAPALFLAGVLLAGTAGSVVAYAIAFRNEGWRTRK